MEIKHKVLVIDDDFMVLRTMEVILKRQGYEYCLAVSGQDALKYVSEKEFDIIISDIRMPMMNGIDVVSAIQAQRKNQNKKDLPIIFITGYADDSFYLNAGKLGEVIQKPFDLRSEE